MADREMTDREWIKSLQEQVRDLRMRLNVLEDLMLHEDVSRWDPDNPRCPKCGKPMTEDPPEFPENIAAGQSVYICECGTECSEEGNIIGKRG